MVCKCEHWFLRRILKIIVESHADEIARNRFISKPALYKEFTLYRPWRREETRHILSLLARTLDGIVFSNAGLWIDPSHLELTPRAKVLGRPCVPPLSRWTEERQ